MKKPVPKNRPSLETNDLIRLNRDVAICAVEDASCLKTPFVVCHALDCRLVFTGEGHICKIVARREYILPDASYPISNCHTFKPTILECVIFNTCN